MERNICRLHGGMKNDKIALFDKKTNFNDQWLRTVEHNSFQTRWKPLESKTFNNYL